MKMAEEAKSKPMETKTKSNVKDFEFDRPMTSKEKEEYFREKASQARKSGKEVVSSPEFYSLLSTLTWNKSHTNFTE